MTTEQSFPAEPPAGLRAGGSAPGAAVAEPGLARRAVLLAPILGLTLGAAPRSASAAGSAAQAPFTLTGRTCAFIMIDLQVSNEHLPFQPHSFGDVVRSANVVAAAVRRSGGLVAHTHVVLADVLDLPADEPLPSPPVAVDGAEFATNAGPAPGDVVITKRQWGAFYATDLDQQLRRRKVDTLLIGGVATEFGVESTIRAAYDQGYALVFVEDAISGAAKESSDFFMNGLFRHIGRVRSSAQVVSALSAT